MALKVLSHLPAESILTSALVCRKWRKLADDELLWRNLCETRGWAWKPTSRSPLPVPDALAYLEEDDEGYDDEELPLFFSQDTGDASLSSEGMVASSSSSSPSSRKAIQHLQRKPNYKLLHQTHVRLLNRIRNCNYTLSTLQTPDLPMTAHTNAIYCLQIFTYPDTGEQVLLTGSKDKTVREWDLQTGLVKRVILGGHASSVLSLWAHGKSLVTGGSDRLVLVWDLATGRVTKAINDHTDSVLCTFLLSFLNDQ